MNLELDQFRDVDLVIDYANYTFIEKQFVSQGDYKGRTLTVLVTNKGVVGEVPGLILNLNWHNEASGLTDLTAFSVLDKANSIYRIEYPQNMMTPGKVIASIQVIQDGKVTNLKQFELTVQNLAGQPVGIVEKAEFSALVAVLADANKFRTDIDDLSIKKAEKSDLEKAKQSLMEIEQNTQRIEGDLNKKIDKGETESISPGMLTPEVLNLIGNGGEIEVNTSMLVDKSITFPKIADRFNLLSIGQKYANKYMQSVSSDGTITMTDTANYFVYKIPLRKAGKTNILKSALAHGQALVIANEDKAISYWSFDFGNMFNASWAKNKTSYYSIDFRLLKQAYPQATHIFVEYRIEDEAAAYAYAIETDDITDKEWAKGVEFDKMRNIPNRLSERFDLLKEETTVIYPNTSIQSYDTTTLKPNMNSVTNRTSYLFDIPFNGKLRFPRYTLPDQQFLLLADASGNVIKNYDYSVSSGVTKIGWIEMQEEYFMIDIDLMRNNWPTAAKVYLVVWNTSVDGFYVESLNGIKLTDAFPFVEKGQEKELILPSEYFIVDNKTGYLYLDNILLNGNYYVDHDVFVNDDTKNDVISGGLSLAVNGSDISVPLARIEDGIVKERASILVKKVNGNVGSGTTKRVLAIGESTTEAQAFRTALVDRFSTDPMSIVMDGTRGSSDTKHEGRSGWTTEHLLNSQTYNSISNSFYNPDTKQFDFQYYLQTNNIQTPDVVLLHFGINDANQGISPEQTIANLYKIINQIKAANPNVKFSIGLTSNLCRIENVAYRTESRRNNILKTIKALIKEFDNKKSQGFYLNAMFLNVDPIYDMRFEERSLSIYQEKTTLYCTDGTHPADSTGYQKTADTTYFTIKRMFA